MHLAQILKSAKATVYQDDQRKELDVMGHRSALPDLVERVSDVDNVYDGNSVFAITPYGPGACLGYDGPTAAWFVLHNKYPALISRADDEDLDPYIEIWVNHWLEHAKITRWPTSNAINEAFEIPQLLPGKLHLEEINNFAKSLRRKNKRGIKASLTKSRSNIHVRSSVNASN